MTPFPGVKTTSYFTLPETNSSTLKMVVSNRKRSGEYRGNIGGIAGPNKKLYLADFNGRESAGELRDSGL